MHNIVLPVLPAPEAASNEPVGLRRAPNLDRWALPDSPFPVPHARLPVPGSPVPRPSARACLAGTE